MNDDDDDNDGKPWVRFVFMDRIIMSVLAPLMDTISLVRLLSATNGTLRRRFAVNHSPTGHIAGIKGVNRTEIAVQEMTWRKILNLKVRIKKDYNIECADSATRNPLKRFLEIMSKCKVPPDTKSAKFYCYRCNKFRLGSHLIDKRLYKINTCKDCVITKYQPSIVKHSGCRVFQKQFKKCAVECYRQKSAKIKDKKMVLEWDKFAKDRTDQQSVATEFSKYASLYKNDAKVLHFDTDNLNGWSESKTPRYWYIPDFEEFTRDLFNDIFDDFLEKIKIDLEKKRSKVNDTENTKDDNNNNKKIKTK